MIVRPKNQEEYGIMSAFLHEYAHVAISLDLEFIGLIEDKTSRLKIVVGFGSWLGKTCQIHVAYSSDWHYTPRALLEEVFKYAFITRDRELIFGIVNSNNTKAMKYDLHLGFVEMWRVPGMHDDGGDIVVLGMTQDNCRYLLTPDTETVGTA